MIFIVTDSSSYLAADSRVLVVPLQVIIGGRSYDDLPMTPTTLPWPHLAPAAGSPAPAATPAAGPPAAPSGTPPTTPTAPSASPPAAVWGTPPAAVSDTPPAAPSATPPAAVLGTPPAAPSATPPAALSDAPPAGFLGTPSTAAPSGDSPSPTSAAAASGGSPSPTTTSRGEPPSTPPGRPSPSLAAAASPDGPPSSPARPSPPGPSTATPRPSPITTSRPSPERFLEAYTEAAARGATGVVSIHLSGDLSGTADAAKIAARDAPIPVEVVDTRSIAMGLGFPVLAATQAAKAGASLEQVAATARHRASTTRTFFYVDTLEYLRRGGRIGAAASLVGSALHIKPLLHITDGKISPLEKVRTAARGIARLEDLAVDAAGLSEVEVAVQHVAALDRANALADHLRQRLPNLATLMVVELGTVIGAHVGPGMLGLTISPTP
ncbi:DegV family protein [Nonomuraea sp. NPDC050556]|uniref:DegV family protein n=1 Tax=Nonomuraea sp. NPDC050556 TaxID=3364369 RepID=UPI00378CE9C4